MVSEKVSGLKNTGCMRDVEIVREQENVYFRVGAEGKYWEVGTGTVKTLAWYGGVVCDGHDRSKILWNIIS